MTRAEIQAMCESVGIPCAYYKFDEDSGIQPPFLVWYYPGSDGWFADDERYVDMEQLAVELYTDVKDFDMEARVEQALKAHGLSYTWDETYLQEELMFEKIYSMEVLIDAEQ